MRRLTWHVFAVSLSLAYLVMFSYVFVKWLLG